MVCFISLVQKAPRLRQSFLMIKSDIRSAVSSKSFQVDAVRKVLEIKNGGGDLLSLDMSTMRPHHFSSSITRQSISRRYISPLIRVSLDSRVLGLGPVVPTFSLLSISEWETAK